MNITAILVSVSIMRAARSCRISVRCQTAAPTDAGARERIMGRKNACASRSGHYNDYYFGFLGAALPTE